MYQDRNYDVSVAVKLTPDKSRLEMVSGAKGIYSASLDYN